MKFDQALREGYNNYVSEDEETISIGRNTLEKIKNILIDKEVVGVAIDRLKKGPDPDNPDFDAAGIAGGEIFFGTSAGKARKAVMARQALMNKGVDLYHKRTQELSDKMDKALQTKTLPTGKY